MKLLKLVNVWKNIRIKLSSLHQGLPGRPHLASDAARVAWRHVVFWLDVQGFGVDLRG